MTVDEYRNLEAELRRLRSEEDQLKGELRPLRAELEALGCKDVAAARKLLASLKREREAAEAELGRLESAFEKKWGGRL